MHPLDDPARFSLDRSGMFAHLRSVGDQLEHAWEESGSLVLPTGSRDVHGLAINGMGGSATAGDYFQALCGPAAKIPIAVTRGFGIPGWANERTLAVFCSYSGNTEETAWAFGEARKRGCPALVISRGGELGRRAVNAGVPLWRITYESSPRAATMQSLAPLMRVGQTLGICPVTDAQVAEAAAGHRTCVAMAMAEEVPAAQNPAKALATQIAGRMVLVLGAEHLAAAAVRFKNQLSENGKVFAFADALPEAGHNLVVGLETARNFADRLAVIILDSELYHPRVRRRVRVMKSLFESEGVPVHRVTIEGDDILSQLMVATAGGDYTSAYLALLNGVDPTPVPQIDALKRGLQA